MISFIVPAHNEQACLGGTLRAIHESARAAGVPYEIVVANDASTDATAEVARENGARVVSVNHRQIAATRNSGARAAVGERLFFVDADTTINAEAAAEALRQMDKGAVGGGGPVRFGKDEVVPLYIQLVSVFQVVFTKAAGFTGGAFMFCTREAFRATGGFNERLFWAEEARFHPEIETRGALCGVVEAGVDVRAAFSRDARCAGSFGLCAKADFFSRATGCLFTQRATVEKIWYDSESHAG